ncbi:hypothetical protein [Pseudomonas sp. LB3P25]
MIILSVQELNWLLDGFDLWRKPGKRKPLSAELPRVEVIHELPEHELTCVCGCRKHVISEEISAGWKIMKKFGRELSRIAG